MILSNVVLDTEEHGLSGPTMSAQKPNAHSPALFVNCELYISNSQSTSRTALSILQTEERNLNVRSQSNRILQYYLKIHIAIKR